MLVLQLRSGFHLVGFLYTADDLGTGARRARNAAEPTPPPEQGIETGLTLLSGALGGGERRITGVGCGFLDDLGTGARKSRNASESEPSPPRQQIKPPEQGQGVGDGDEEGIGAGAASSWWETGTAAVSCSTAPPTTLGQQETKKTSSAPSSSTTSTATRGCSRSPSDVGDGDGDQDEGAGGEELGCRDRDGLLGGGDDAGGGEDLGRRLRLLQQQQQHRTLRLRGGAADYHHAAAVPASHTWVAVMGLPMVQTVPGTCALVAATVCVEAQHRRKFEAKYGPETFACRPAAPRKLRQACFRDKVWNPSNGKHERTWDPNTGAWTMDRVLRVMHRLGGARTTNAAPPAPFFLPLDHWDRYGYEDGGGLTAGAAARLLYERGPCVGTLFATPEFFETYVIPGSGRPPAIFRGCRREDRERERTRGRGTMHAVVCFAYALDNRGRLCILVLDSQRATGPIRWVDFHEFDAFYVLTVQALPSTHLIDLRRFPPLVYPISLPY